MLPYFCLNFEKNGTNKKIQRHLVACLPCFNCGNDFCYLYSLGVAYTYSPLPDHIVCKGDGHLVINHIRDIFCRAPPTRELFCVSGTLIDFYITANYLRLIKTNYYEKSIIVITYPDYYWYFGY